MYIGIPPFGQTVRTVTTITASASQTTFTPNGGYTVGYVDVYYNGIKLVGGVDFTASNGLTVVLTTGATANAVVEIVAYGSVSLADSIRRSGDTFAGTVNFPNNNIIAANGNIGIGNTMPGAPLVIGSSSGAYTNPLVQAAGSANSWVQISAQNLNNGNNASTDLVLGRSDGNDVTKYIDIGINSNTYNQAAYSIMTPGSGYVFVNGGDLSLGTQTNNNIIFHTGNTTAASERMRIANNGLIGIGNGSNAVSTATEVLNITDPNAYALGLYRNLDYNSAGSMATLIQMGGYIGSARTIGASIAGAINTPTEGWLDINARSGSGTTTIARFRGNGAVELPYGQIKFPATQNASSDGNTLDDYEEGTWSPWSAADLTTYGITIPAGARYTKIGNVCFVSFRFLYTSTATTQIQFVLPFTAANYGAGSSSPTFMKASWASGGPSTIGFAYNGQVGDTSVSIYSENTNYAAVNWNSIASKNVTVTGHYYTI